MDFLFHFTPSDTKQLLFYIFLYMFGLLHCYWAFCYTGQFPDTDFGKTYNWYFYMSFIWPVLAIWGMWKLHKKDNL